MLDGSIYIGTEAHEGRQNPANSRVNPLGSVNQGSYGCSSSRGPLVPDLSVAIGCVMALLMLCIATATRPIETRQFSSSLYLATGKSPDKDQGNWSFSIQPGKR